MAPQVQDDGFHEIQLNGKQLVFLFMAATVVSVVIFLCGVLVGRGVRIERAAMAQSDVSGEAPTADAVTSPTATSGVTPTIGDPTSASPPPTVDDLSYPKRLENGGPAPDDLRPSPSKPAAATAAEKSPARQPQPKPPAAAAATPTPAATSTASAEPAPSATATASPATTSGPVPDDATPAPGPGYAVQVAALNVRSEADAIARRLTSKGYSAYVQVPTGGGTPSVFRVRVGTFKTRREADAVAAKLQKEEQFQPWVTR